MKIMKASAGSGKTFNLAKTYIDQLLSSNDRYAYRHILAVTFTNKATAEMKSRILRDLGELAKTDRRAKDILTDILHDYSAFAISTIDKFFQQALKAFSREIGQFSSYQVELDRNALVNEAMDRILDGLSEDKKDLVGWLKASVMDKIEQGQRFKIDEGLYEIGALLKSDEYRELREKYNIDTEKEFSKERLTTIREACREVIIKFHTKISGTAQAAARTLTKPSHIKYIQPYLKQLNFWDEVSEPNKTLSTACAGTAFMDCFGESFSEYKTARQIDKLIFSLGLAGEFHKEFDALLKEKSVMPLDDSNTILRDIIDGSDAPFVYEKLGVRFEHFLLDEFQDTSSIQWDNFLPLLRESESKSPDNLVVGDVKQSIYRWRDSDWRLLGEEVGKEFPEAEVIPLDCNWRSAKTIVEFNNDFFKFAAAQLGCSDIYSDVYQKIKTKETQEGFVRISFSENQADSVLESIKEARDAGAKWKDIAILVRGRKEGSALADLLIGNEIPVISDDSLSLKSSIVVRRLVSILNHIENPGNDVGSFLARSMNIKVPDSYHSLVDLCEGLLRSLKEYEPASFEGETLFIQAFMDDLQDWVDINGNNLLYYLKHWNESDPYIGSPESADSIRVLTIHKSKGLEFPYVIFPYAEKVTLYKDDTHWCHIKRGNSKFSHTVEGLYPVRLGKSSTQTLFADDYDEERKMQTVDNINVFYVALTRASKVLHVISSEPTKTFKDSLDADMPKYSNFGDLLYKFCAKSKDCKYGSMYDFNAMEREEENKELDFPASYPSIPAGGRLKASEDAEDFFGEDGLTGAAASARLNGIALHNILSSINAPGEIRSAVDAAVLDGVLDREEGDKAEALLSARIASHPDWFSREVMARNEVTIFDTDGREWRPDRVVIDGNSVTVIDYKFGEERESYRRQVARYCQLYRSMGYENVTGYVWYVPDDKVVAVSL